MWIQDVNRNLINLNLTGMIRVQEVFYGKDNGKFEVRTETPVGMEVSLVYASLLVGTKEECQAFVERLTALLGDKVLKI